MLAHVEDLIVSWLDLPRWRSAALEERRQQMQQLFSRIAEELHLPIQLHFDMPPGFEQANGLSDPETGDIRINAALWPQQGELEPLFYFLHELRHSLQTAFPGEFPPEFAVNAKYVFQFDGTAYKFTGDGMKTVQLTGTPDYFVELYLASPCERDAIAFAHRILHRCGAGESIDRLYAMWSPKYTCFAESEATAVFLQAVQEVDRLTSPTE